MSAVVCGCLRRKLSVLRMEINDITYATRGAVFEVNRVLGHGFLEKVYENALMLELRLRGLKAESQVPLKVYYKENMVYINFLI